MDRFPYFSMKIYIMGTYWNCFTVAIPVTTHKMFHREIRKYFYLDIPLNQDRHSTLTYKYSKCPKISNTKVSNKISYTNSVDPDQTAPEGAV